MKNQLGQKLTKSVLARIWNDAAHTAFVARNQDTLDEKAHNVYHERLLEAKKNGATWEEMDSINAKDVTLTMGDRITAALVSVRIGAFFSELHYWLTLEPYFWH